ncbi:unnamed protein product, partial [Symbiodinium natans]
RELTSAALPQRLATGSVLEELEAADNRLHFRRLVGTGPDEGWVSIAVAGKRLLSRAEEAFSGTWEDDEGTEVVIEGLLMHGLGTSLPLEVSGVRMCSFKMSGEVFQGRLLGDGRLLWSDGALWCRKAMEGGLLHCEEAPGSTPAQSRLAKAKAKPGAGGLRNGFLSWEKSVLHPSQVRCPFEAAGCRWAKACFEVLLEASKVGCIEYRPLPERTLSPKEIWIVVDFLSSALASQEIVDTWQPRIPLKGGYRRTTKNYRRTTKDEWIAEAADVFETMLLPLEVEGFKGANTRYKQLLLLVHPDKNRQEGATDAFRKLFDAFAVIVDPAAPPGSGARFCARRAARAAKPEKVSSEHLDLRALHLPKSAISPARSFNLDLALGGIGGVVAAVFMQDNVDESERVLHEQSELLEALGKYDGSDKTWVSPETAKVLWDTVKDSGSCDAAIFVDVRDGDEYDTSRIENAMNISWGFANLVRGTEEFKQLEKYPSKMVIVYSDNGSQLSRCGQVATTLGYFLRTHQVRRLRRGLNAWKRHGYPVEGSRQTFFARQRLGDNILKVGDSGYELEEGQKSLAR